MALRFAFFYMEDMKALSDRTTWPLFWCLKPECQAKVMQFQWDRYGVKLDILTESQDDEPSVISNYQLESGEEIARFMRIGARYGRLPKHLR